MNTVEVISLVYKSVPYTRFITDELLATKAPENWQVKVRIIANDPADPDTLLQYPRAMGVPVDVFRNKEPAEYYLNRVYRCFNYGGASSAADHICFVNSDMAFHKDWLSALLKHHDGKNIPCSRLVESGKMPSGAHGISKNFGRSPETFDRAGFMAFADTVKQDVAMPDGLFMPSLFEKQRFVEAGMFPEGNIYWNGAGTCSGRVQMSGDRYFFNKLISQYGMRHITVFDSLVYHVQEGEMRS